MANFMTLPVPVEPDATLFVCPSQQWLQKTKKEMLASACQWKCKAKECTLDAGTGSHWHARRQFCWPQTPSRPGVRRVQDLNKILRITASASGPGGRRRVYQTRKHDVGKVYTLLPVVLLVLPVAWAARPGTLALQVVLLPVQGNRSKGWALGVPVASSNLKCPGRCGFMPTRRTTGPQPTNVHRGQGGIGMCCVVLKKRG